MKIRGYSVIEEGSGDEHGRFSIEAESFEHAAEIYANDDSDDQEPYFLVGKTFEIKREDGEIRKINVTAYVAYHCTEA